MLMVDKTLRMIISNIHTFSSKNNFDKLCASECICKVNQSVYCFAQKCLKVLYCCVPSSCTLNSQRFHFMMRLHLNEFTNAAMKELVWETIGEKKIPSYGPVWHELHAG